MPSTSPRVRTARFAHLLVNTLLVSSSTSRCGSLSRFGSSWRRGRCWRREWCRASSWSPRPPAESGPLMSVQSWGLLWGALSAGFIVGGLAVAKSGLDKSPVRLLLLGKVVLWSVTCLFPLRSSVILLAAGMAVYTVLLPYAEEAEQTVLK